MKFCTFMCMYVKLETLLAITKYGKVNWKSLVLAKVLFFWKFKISRALWAEPIRNFNRGAVLTFNHCCYHVYESSKNKFNLQFCVPPHLIKLVHFTNLDLVTIVLLHLDIFQNTSTLQIFTSPVHLYYDSRDIPFTW